MIQSEDISSLLSGCEGTLSRLHRINSPNYFLGVYAGVSPTRKSAHRFLWWEGDGIHGADLLHATMSVERQESLLSVAYCMHYTLDIHPESPEFSEYSRMLARNGLSPHPQPRMQEFC